MKRVMLKTEVEAELSTISETILSTSMREHYSKEGTRDIGRPAEYNAFISFLYSVRACHILPYLSSTVYITHTNSLMLACLMSGPKGGAGG